MSNGTTLVEKLLRRALDPAASEGEATNSAQKMVVVARRENVTYDAMITTLAPPAREVPVEHEDPPYYGVTLKFGKYSGMRLRDVADEDIDYLVWMIRNCSRLSAGLRAAVVNILHDYGYDAEDDE